ncbi:hypothetical protein PIB30_057361 [Stylosanthes scabra]|uniref:F-box protein n=1 Tax=Stylosanthes scabra TaxID=79078 RepID=A0ABU6ZIF1_9FABA|nr:hypothetical protein [Stylosanthes scabra]
MAATSIGSVKFPSLSDAIISDILAMADLKTIDRCKTLSIYWKNEMQSDEFLLMHSELVKKKCGSIYLHVDSPRMRRGGKLFKLHACTGALQEMNLPFNVSEDSKLTIIGAGNGIIALHCSKTDKTGQLVVLDPKYVIYNGVLYWLNLNDHAGTSPHCIVYYSAKDNEFGYILIPTEAVNLEKRQISIEGTLCFVGVEHDEESDSYTWTMWIIMFANGSKEWTVAMKGSGVGHLNYPKTFIGKGILMLSQRVIFRRDGDASIVLNKQIRIRGLSSIGCQTRTIQNMEFRVDAYTKSLLAMYDTAFPV